MGIKVVYQPDFNIAGRLAYDAGEGEYRKQEAKFLESQRQFNQQISQRESQFGRELQYKQELAALQAAQKDRQMGQQAYQFERGLQATSADRQANRLAQYGLAGMRSQEAETARNAQAGFARSRQEREIAARVTAAGMERAYQQAVAVAKHVYRTPEQAEQARIGWVKDVGSQVGMDTFPALGPADINPNSVEVGKIDARVRELAGRYGADPTYGDSILKEIRATIVEEKDGELVPRHETAKEQDAAVDQIKDRYSRDALAEANRELSKTTKEEARLDREAIREQTRSLKMSDAEDKRELSHADNVIKQRLTLDLDYEDEKGRIKSDMTVVNKDAALKSAKETHEAKIALLGAIDVTGWTNDQIAALPSKTRIRTPDGKIRVKP